MNTDKVKILLAGSDEFDCVLIRGLLSKSKGLSHALNWVETYEDALKEIQTTPYDIHVYDYRLGDRTGLDLLNEVLANGSQIPIIIMAGQPLQPGWLWEPWQIMTT